MRSRVSSPIRAADLNEDSVLKIKKVKDAAIAYCNSGVYQAIQPSQPIVNTNSTPLQQIGHKKQKTPDFSEVDAYRNGRSE